MTAGESNEADDCPYCPGTLSRMDDYSTEHDEMFQCSNGDCPATFVRVIHA